MKENSTLEAVGAAVGNIDSIFLDSIIESLKVKRYDMTRYRIWSWLPKTWHDRFQSYRPEDLKFAQRWDLISVLSTIGISIMTVIVACVFLIAAAVGELSSGTAFLLALVAITPLGGLIWASGSLEGVTNASVLLHRDSPEKKRRTIRDHCKKIIARHQKKFLAEDGEFPKLILDLDKRINDAAEIVEGFVSLQLRHHVSVQPDRHLLTVGHDTAYSLWSRLVDEQHLVSQRKEKFLALLRHMNNKVEIFANNGYVNTLFVRLAELKSDSAQLLQSSTTVFYEASADLARDVQNFGMITEHSAAYLTGIAEALAPADPLDWNEQKYVSASIAGQEFDNLAQGMFPELETVQ